jgi:hypothetical protein
MSHFSQIKTQIRDLTSLQAALTDLNIDWKPGPQKVKCYQGLTHTADVVIDQDNGYGVGFSWNGQQYEMVADLQYWQQPLSVEGFIKKVTQRYAYHTVVRESVKQGFELAEQEQQQDGSIRLVLQRWNG